ncbi:MAG: hypothetical protein JXM69_07910 [Anaerolineae bacterium]|nr:hypothetical protein [Anaerolineae bacterium]
MTWRRVFIITFLTGIFFILATSLGRAQGGTTYYVSASDGADTNTGLTPTPGSNGPFKTIAHVNSLDLEPGDQVLFKCGDTWRGEQLIISKSGTSTDQITFGSYPTTDCANKPIISGSLPITDWVDQGGNIYQADLSAGDNAGKFPDGINQLFRNDERMMMGRWPNIDAPNSGYSFVDSHTADSNQITDNELPSGVNWTGAIIHLKNIRWSMIDRQVTGSSDHTLTLNTDFSCLISGWADCIGWGYFINNHLSTLDQEGEWYYDAPTNQVYLFSTGGMPSNIEGSVVKETDPDPAAIRHGGIMLSDTPPSSYVTIDNLEIKNWFNHGISALGSIRGDIYHHITIRNSTIKDVEAAGVRLSTWVRSANNGRDGTRGGHHMTFANNMIDGANHFGITGYMAESTFEDNEIKNIALIKNLNKSGMGCGITRGECTENGDGFRIRVYNVLDSGFSNTLHYNRFEKIGYNGIDIFGPHNTVTNNFITRACYSKADCGGVRTFGGSTLSSTNVHDVSLVNNIIVDIPGNVDGCHASRPAFGMGLYIDHYSRDMEVRGNTVISTTITGILYQNSTGEIRDNTVYNASSGTAFAGQINVADSGSVSVARASLSNNIMYGLGDYAWLLVMDERANITASDNNYFFHPYEHTAYEDKKIIVGGWSGRRNLAEWQAYSGLDNNSKKHWFTLNAGDPPLSTIFYNDTTTSQTVDLANRKYLTLDQQEVTGSIILAPFTSKVLIDSGEVALAPARLVFDTSSSPPQIVTLKNITDNPLQITDISVTAGFSIDSETCPATLAVDETCTITISFDSAETGVTGTLSVTHDAGNPYTVTLTGGLLKNYLPVVLK